MTTLRSLLLAMAGKGAERGMEPEIREDLSSVVFRYVEPTDERGDNLHKQSIRSLVERVGGEEWKIHITSLGETGFAAEVRTKPGIRVEEQHAPVVDTGSIESLATTLEDVAKRLRELAA